MILIFCLVIIYHHLGDISQFSCMYEGRSISKLQNGVILLIFRLWKFQNLHFVRDLILSTTYEFYYGDVIYKH